MFTLLTLPLRCKRDAILARQRARQTAVLFHFEQQEQAAIAAGVFTLATDALRHSRCGQLCIQIEKRTLHVFVEPSLARSRIRHAEDEAGSRTGGAKLRLVKALPAAGADLADGDLVWLMQQLSRRSRFHAFEELEHQNQEMLGLLCALRNAQAQIAALKDKWQIPSAA